MEQRFRLQAHEVWREGLVREGVYGQSADFADVLPKGVWNESQFVFGRYNARKGEETLTGHILFRPENGAEEENFLLATDVMGGMRGMGDPHFCNLGEFFFGSERVDEKQIVMALKTNQWGRVFYLDADNLRADGTMMPCDWGVFLAANGMGLWKWTMRDGVTWGKASNQGIFRWHEEPEAARFLATHSASDLKLLIQQQLSDADSEMAFARRWLQSEEDERINIAYHWKNGGTRAEFEKVLHWLLLSELSLQTETRLMWRIFPFGENGDRTPTTLDGPSGELEWPERLNKALFQLLSFFDLQPKNHRYPHPLCVQHSYIDDGLYANIKNPTAHERLEAQLQLTQWAQERGLSFD